MLLFVEATHPDYYLFLMRVEFIMKIQWKDWFRKNIEDDIMEHNKSIEGITERQIGMQQIESILTNTITNIIQYDYNAMESGYYSTNLYNIKIEAFRNGLRAAIDKHIQGFAVKSSACPQILPEEYIVFKKDNYEKGEYVLRMFLYFLKELQQNSLVFYSC